MNRISTIAVDLTPLLPGGENGGAKIFVVELIRGLADSHPETNFVLLTQPASHDELAALDRPNVSRMLAHPEPGPRVWQRRLNRYRRSILKRLPGPLANPLATWLRHRAAMQSETSLLRNVGADLLFCPFTAPLFFDPHTPTVSIVYDLQYRAYPEFFSPEEVLQREETFTTACLRSSAIAVISDFVRDTLLQNDAVDPDRVFTIHIRLPERAPVDGQAVPADVLRGFGLSPHKYLFYPANFWRHKNHEMLVTALSMARAQGLAKDIKLVLTGAPSPRMAELQRSVDLLGLTEQVVFAGFVSAESFAALMKNCLALIFPSLYEGFGIPMVEAMAAGRPVACSDRGSLPEVVGNAALIFDPRIPSQVVTAIIRLASDEQLRMDLIERGKQQAQLFTDSSRMTREYWDLFERAIANQRIELSLTGVYPDGWAGPMLTLHYPASDSHRWVKMELHAPQWAPLPQVVAEVSSAADHTSTRIVLNAGESQTYTSKLGAGRNTMKVRFSPTFRPAEVLHNGDNRDLSLRIGKISLYIDDEVNSIFPST